MPGLLGLSPDSSVGSFARARVEFDVFVLMIDYLRSQVAGVINHQLVFPLTALNFGVDADEAPVFRFLPLTDDLRLEMFKTWTEMVAGQVVSKVKEDEEHIRKAFGMPSLDDSTPLPPPEEPPEEGPEEEDPEPDDDGGDDNGGGTDGLTFEYDQTVPKTLYASRRLKNTDEFIAWAKGQGFSTTIVPEDIHVTIAFSRDKVVWGEMGDHFDEIRVPASSKRSVEVLGDKGAVILRFESVELQKRWHYFRSQGASWDHDGYKPHITISYDAGDLDLEDVEPFTGELIFGPERFEELDEGWADKVVEQTEDACELVVAYARGVQPRRPKGSQQGGQFAPKGGEGGSASGFDTGLKLRPTKDRAWDGEQAELSDVLSKQEVGDLGERTVVQYLQDQGFEDARPLNLERNNFPVDLVQNHEVIEVKAGLASNGKSAQQWRATIGQPGVKEREWLKTASLDEKREWNAKKMQAILDRKEAARASVSQKLGRKVKGATITTVVNSNKKVVDIYKFDGFHSRIAWNSAQAQAAYVGSFKYANS